MQFHQSYDGYDQQPGLQALLRKPVNLFNIDLVNAIKWQEHKIHLQRVFPHGCVILMTEDFILCEPKNALRVMRWFLDYLPGKFPGTWKIFFRPNIVGWLAEIFDTWPDETCVSPFFFILHYSGTQTR